MHKLNNFYFSFSLFCFNSKKQKKKHIKQKLLFQIIAKCNHNTITKCRATVYFLNYGYLRRARRFWVNEWKAKLKKKKKKTGTATAKQLPLTTGWWYSVRPRIWFKSKSKNKKKCNAMKESFFNRLFFARLEFFQLFRYSFTVARLNCNFHIGIMVCGEVQV